MCLFCHGTKVGKDAKNKDIGQSTKRATNVGFAVNSRILIKKMNREKNNSGSYTYTAGFSRYAISKQKYKYSTIREREHDIV